jgi:hypothetical protein
MGFEPCEYSFYGWDYSELANRWGFHVPETDQLEAFEYIQIFISNYAWPGIGRSHTRFQRRAAKDVREYLVALSRCDAGYLGGFWKAMSEIKDDWSMMRMFVHNLGFAWS